MKKSNLKLSILSLLILLIQNSHADEYNYQAGLGSIAYSNRNVAVGSSYRENNVENKNVAGAPDKIIDYATAIGIANKATYHYSSAFGFQNESTADSSSAFGYRNKANRGYSSAFGARNMTKGIYSSAFGYMNKVIGDSSSAFGARYAVTGNSSGAFGVGKTSFSDEHEYINEGNNSYMIGNKNKIASGSDDNFILGNNVHIGGGINNSVALGNNSTVSASNTVSVGSSTLKRKIVNVGDGEISASSTDAVTGRQLYSGNGIDTAAWQNKLNVTKKNDYKDANDIDVNKWRTKLGVGSGGGGGAPVDSYTKSEADNKFANKTDLDNYTKKDDYKDANGIDVDKWKAKLGTGAGTADIENLRNEVNEKIDDVEDEVRTVGSLSAALAGLHPMQYDPKAPVQVMAALGHYRDKQSVAVGASYYFNDRFMMSTGIALSGEKRTKTMANVGFTLKLGKGSGVAYNETPLYTIQDEVKRLTIENNKQAKENQELKERVRNLEEKLNMLLKNK